MQQKTLINASHYIMYKPLWQYSTRLNKYIVTELSRKRSIILIIIVVFWRLFYQNVSMT